MVRDRGLGVNLNDAGHSTASPPRLPVRPAGPAFLAIPLASGNEEMLVNDGTAPVGDGPSAPSAGELIEPGRALALADFAPPSISAGERLLRFAYRLGIPGTTLSGPFRKPGKPRLPCNRRRQRQWCLIHDHIHHLHRLAGGLDRKAKNKRRNGTPLPELLIHHINVRVLVDLRHRQIEHVFLEISHPLILAGQQAQLLTKLLQGHFGCFATDPPFDQHLIQAHRVAALQRRHLLQLVHGEIGLQTGDVRDHLRTKTQSNQRLPRLIAHAGHPAHGQRPVLLAVGVIHLNRHPAVEQAFGRFRQGLIRRLACHIEMLHIVFGTHLQQGV